MKSTAIILGLFVGCATASAAIVLPPGATWNYTVTNPTGDSAWNTTTGVGGIWVSGSAPFSNHGSGDFSYTPSGTFWAADGSDGDDRWLRRTLDMTGFDISTAAWDLGVDNGFKLYINGALIASANAEGGTHRWEYTGGFGGFLTPGLNVLAVALEDHGGATAFDMQVRATPVVPEPSTWIAGLSLAVMAGSHLLRRRQV